MTDKNEEETNNIITFLHDSDIPAGTLTIDFDRGIAVLPNGTEVNLMGEPLRKIQKKYIRSFITTTNKVIELMSEDRAVIHCRCSAGSKCRFLDVEIRRLKVITTSDTTFWVCASTKPFSAPEITT